MVAFNVERDAFPLTVGTRMALLFRWCLSLSSAVAVVCGLAFVGRAVGIDLGLDDLAALAREQARGERLARRSQALVERNQGKRRVTALLLAGRLTLAQAAEEFRRLNEQLRADGCDSDLDDLAEESLCRNALLWVRAEVPNGNDPAAADVLRDLEGQYVARFGHPVAYTETRPVRPSVS